MAPHAQSPGVENDVPGVLVTPSLSKKPAYSVDLWQQKVRGGFAPFPVRHLLSWRSHSSWLKVEKSRSPSGELVTISCMMLTARNTST